MAVPPPLSERRFLESVNKDEQRLRALERRRAFARSITADQRRRLEDRLCEIVLPHLANARVVAGYHPMRDEFSPDPVLRSLGDSVRIALPWFADRDAVFTFREAPAVEKGPWGMQPSAAAPVLHPDALLIPLVLADRGGARIGHGKGHYDRALATVMERGSVMLIGIGWDEQLSEVPLPADPWDVRLHAVATPAGWVNCR